MQISFLFRRLFLKAVLAMLVLSSQGLHASDDTPMRSYYVEFLVAQLLVGSSVHAVIDFVSSLQYQAHNQEALSNSDFSDTESSDSAESGGSSPLSVSTNFDSDTDSETEADFYALSAWSASPLISAGSLTSTLSTLSEDTLEDLAIHVVLTQSPGDSPQTLNTFADGLIAAGSSVAMSNHLSWVSQRASSSYGAWRFRINDWWHSIHDAWCWELYCILLYESGYSTDRNLHQAFIRAMTSRWSQSDHYPSVPLSEPMQFQAGDLIFLNSHQHIVIATGHGDEVFSLWNRPHDGVSKIKLTKLLEIWPFADLPAVHRVPVDEIFSFLEKEKEKEKAKT